MVDAWSRNPPPRARAPPLARARAWWCGPEAMTGGEGGMWDGAGVGWLAVVAGG